MTEQASDPTKCYIHPNREATLRCNQCDRPICVECAVKVPTGYRCRECVRGQQKRFNTAMWYDFPLGMLIAGGLSFLGSFLLNFLNMGMIGYFMIFILIFGSPAVGKVIAEAVRLVIRKRRSKRLFQAIAAAVVVGGLLPQLGRLALLFSGNLGVVLSLLWPGVYIFLVTSTVYYLLSGIRLTR
jgi:hypothetical protein